MSLLPPLVSAAFRLWALHIAHAYYSYALASVGHAHRDSLGLTRKLLTIQTRIDEVERSLPSFLRGTR